MKSFNGVLFLLPFLAQSIVLLEETDNCLKQIEAVCNQQLQKDLLLGGVANKLQCLVDNKNTIHDECFLTAIQETVQVLQETDQKACHDELNKKCGKAIDALVKEIEKTSVIGILKATVDVVDCLVRNAEDLWKKCSPFEDENGAQEECLERAGSLCPETGSKVMGLGFTLGCLAEQSRTLGMSCMGEAMKQALDEMENSDNKACHDELRKKCGKQIDNLKRQIQDTSIIGTIKGAVDVVECVATNAEDLWKKCSPFEDEMESEDVSVAEIEDISLTGGAPTPPTRKPTKKPTKKTKKPTKKPTKAPSAKTTKVPTMKKVQDELIASLAVDVEGIDVEEDIVADEEESQLSEAIEQGPEMIEMTSTEYDMDACLEAARKICSREIEMFNESPFDQNLMRAVGSCIDFNGEQIESQCIISSTRSSWIAQPFEQVFVMHPACRHPEDVESNLPLCEKKHHCHGRHPHVAFGFLVLLLAATVFGCVRRRALRKKQAEVPVMAPEGYVLLTKAEGV